MLTVLGLSAASSSNPCPYCEVEYSRVNFQNPMQNGEDAITRSKQRLAEQLQNRQTKSAKDCAHVKAPPMHPAFDPISMFVPPPEHLISGVVNRIFKYAAEKKTTELDDLAKLIQAYIQQPGKEFNGNHGRKIVNFALDSGYSGFGADILKNIGRIEKYAVARTLSVQEMDDLDTEIIELFEHIRGLQDFKVTVKLHVLEKHVVNFVRSAGSWGNYSEQCKSFLS